MPIKESVTIDAAIEVLNQAVEADPEAMRALIAHRVPCNEKMASHPTIQVAAAGASGRSARVGMLGILNGMFGVDEHGWGRIAAVLEPGDKVKEFVRVNESDIPVDPALAGKGDLNAR